jgi:hypothetical protein
MNRYQLLGKVAASFIRNFMWSGRSKSEIYSKRKFIMLILSFPEAPNLNYEYYFNI